MQYLLTKKEYQELKEEGFKEEKAQKDIIQDLCTKVADHMPTGISWGIPSIRPWRCIITATREWYCDECPVRQVCPNDNKQWSK